jgi:hypothetical protein
MRGVQEKMEGLLMEWGYDEELGALLPIPMEEEEEEDAEVY